MINFIENYTNGNCEEEEIIDFVGHLVQKKAETDIVY